MNRLIVNTANDELFIVLQKGDNIFYKSSNSKMHHNETMFPLIDELLKANNINIQEIDEFGVVVGPGSFTGIRVGIATIKAFRDSLNGKAKGINNLDYLFKIARNKNPEIETVAISGSKDSYFVARLIHGVVFKYERNLSLKELLEVSENKPVGMFEQDENINCFVVGQDAEAIIDCFNECEDEKLVPVYYQLSQAENEKLKRSEIKLGFATSRDLVDIYNIEKENILTNPMSEKQIIAALTDENYVVLKAEIENDVVGFVILQKSDELNIDSIAVKKEFRNLGIATKLISRAEGFAEENEINTLSLEVSYKNINAYLLYKKLGFIERRIRKNYYANGDDAIEMVKDLKKS